VTLLDPSQAMLDKAQERLDRLCLLGHEQQWCSAFGVEADGEHVHVLHTCPLMSRVGSPPLRAPLCSASSILGSIVLRGDPRQSLPPRGAFGADLA
jgi:hypothetical protein